MNKKIIIAITSTIIAMAVSIPAKASELSINVIPMASDSRSVVGNIITSCPVRDVPNGYVGNSGGTGSCGWTFVGKSLNSLGWGVNDNYYLKWTFYIYELRDRENIHSYVNGPAALNISFKDGTSYNATYIATQAQMISMSDAKIEFIYKINTGGANRVINYLYQDMAIGVQVNEWAINGGLSLYSAQSYGDVIVDNQAVVNAINASNNWLSQINQNIQQVGQNVHDSGANIAQNIAQNETNAGQTAQQDGQQSANTGQQTAESATQNGFQTLGTIIGAFTDTPSGDCTINGNLGNVDLGTLNFCQGNIEPIRPVIRAVIYLVMALGTYKLVMWIIGSIAGLVNYVQTGNEE